MKKKLSGSFITQYKFCLYIILESSGFIFIVVTSEICYRQSLWRQITKSWVVVVEVGSSLSQSGIFVSRDVTDRQVCVFVVTATNLGRDKVARILLLKQDDVTLQSSSASGVTPMSASSTPTHSCRHLRCRLRRHVQSLYSRHQFQSVADSFPVGNCYNIFS